MYKFVIGYGLPGSGKTTYLRSFQDKLVHNGYYSRNSYFNCDELLKLKKEKSLLNLLSEDISYLVKRHYFEKKEYYVIIDALITTNKDLKNVLELIKKIIGEKEYDVSIEWWEEDRDSCVWNDEYRRDTNSINSIMTLPYEKVDMQSLKEELNIPIRATKHTVIRKSKEKHFAQEKNICNDRGILTSERWCLGGNCCDCWGGDYVVHEDIPVNFTEFDVMLEEICPNISFLKYKKIWAECVTIETENENDYYGGSVKYARYQCNIEEVIRILLEMEILKEEDLA
jgi:hypothetical protein